MKPNGINQIARFYIFLLVSVLILTSLASLPLLCSASVAASSTGSLYLPFVSKSFCPYDWLQFNGDDLHSGNNTLENTLSVGNIANLQLLFQVHLPGIADGAPVYLSGVSTASGIHDLIYMTTRDGRIVALDAHTGVLIWSHQYGPGVA